VNSSSTQKAVSLVDAETHKNPSRLAPDSSQDFYCYAVHLLAPLFSRKLPDLALPENDTHKEFQVAGFSRPRSP
jgi:hypothetical protein